MSLSKMIWMIKKIIKKAETVNLRKKRGEISSFSVSPTPIEEGEYTLSYVKFDKEWKKYNLLFLISQQNYFWHTLAPT